MYLVAVGNELMRPNDHRDSRHRTKLGSDLRPIFVPSGSAVHILPLTFMGKYDQPWILAIIWRYVQPSTLAHVVQMHARTHAQTQACPLGN